ncbi:MAG: succinylglutamate desuccinylase/aspartoacylase family protein [Tepidanaerobacter acetatoxydans]|jgi:predicted deacylase|uniref:M99 family carboxypeptidase catalytic domain-containing protein n=1 Tax=Tepidanaerobacter TaxID=499228 RepID=UPI000AFB5AC1|nr:MULTISPECIES: succinylglutamate desuccinylase/aspartoacylase family protein [Tepidanaerobacter]NLU09890.1 succinylglutamate desuccinylase/aspartoacylase family protein [Tepidanaerobacter acetatoxydans]
METQIFYNKGKQKGPHILIIAGLHGNEIAGIKAAEKLKTLVLKRGKLTIIPKANIEACSNNIRYPYYMQDLNRSFPGKKQGTDTQKLAYELYTFIEKQSPDIILDLHEWDTKFMNISKKPYNAIIINDIDANLLPIIKESKKNIYNFDILSCPPKGSLNREVSENLKIPVLTIETDMEKEIEYRINAHLFIIDSILDLLQEEGN